MILAIDVGGTKISMGLSATTGRLVRTCQFPSRDFPSLEAVISAFLRQTISSPAAMITPGGETSDLESLSNLCEVSNISAICAGVAGPAINGTAEITNLPWTISIAALRAATNIDHIFLLNDVEAYAWGALDLEAESLLVLSPGIDRVGNRALIAPGTGLGECLLPWINGEHIPSPSEGGHADFAPSSAGDLPFVSWLYGRYPRISWERVVSGSFGFRNIYDFLRHEGRFDPEESLDQARDRPDFGPRLSQAAQQNVPIAVATLERFCWFLGAETGNLALKACALGGIYVGGGIPPQILPWLQRDQFLTAFREKGRQKKLLEEIPVRIILDGDCALLGAAAYARRQLR